MNNERQRNTFSRNLAGCLALILVALSLCRGQSQAGPFEVTGVVLDPNGAVVSGAKVILRAQGSRVDQVSASDQMGEFHFTRLASGSYEIVVQKEGFRPAKSDITVGPKSPPPVKILMTIAEVREDVAVLDRSNQVSTNPDDNLNVVKLDHEKLNTLPVLGNDVVASLASLLDDGSAGGGGPTVIVDGLETSRTKVPASLIQEIRINQNPYSAEFPRLGRARIEVFTKPGAPEYHGEFNFVFRDYHLDARNSFATQRPPEQRRIYDGNLSGPVWNSRKTSFLFSVNREEEDLQSIIFASTPAGVVSRNIANPNRDTEFSLRINHQAGEKSAFSLRYEYNFDSSKNGGTGGFTLPDAASDSSGHEHQLYFSYRRILTRTLVNEFTLRLGGEYGLSRGGQPDVPKIIVLDAFTGGSAQVDRRSSEHNIQFNEILSWTRGKHFVRTGVNVPEMSRRGLSDRSNFGGTFTFSSLTDFELKHPFLYSVNQGNSYLAFWRKEVGSFAQDNILLRPNFSIGLGLRYDWQNYLGDRNNFAPRLSFAYAPGKNSKTVVRAGAGIFYDRTGAGPIADILRFNGNRLKQVVITNPGFPDPFSSGGTLTTQPSSIVRFAPDIRAPYMFQFSIGVERQLTKSLTATVTYINTRGLNLFRSRNINAPLPPAVDRPDPAIGVLRQIESAARSQAHALEFMLRGRITRFFDGTIQYTLGRAYNNASGINSLPANSYDLTGEWSRAEFDERHRFHLLGTIRAGVWFNLGMTLALTSGRPYSLTTGRDDNHDSVANDRPAGVRRNSLQGPGTATLDLRWSKELALTEARKDDGPVLSIRVDAFNVLNRTNYSGFIGNLSSPFFGLPVAARPARRMQLTLGFQF